MRRTLVKSMGWAAILVATPVLLANGQETSVSASLSTTSLPRGIVILQADTVGQIYIASDRPGEAEEPAKNVLVRVVVPENEETVFETRCDNTGGYLIPRLKPGAYRLHIGALHIPLLVDTLVPSNAQLPKVIITILPRDLTRRP